jgi:hypothetical protein
LLIFVAAALRGLALVEWSGHLTDDRDDYLVVARQYLAHGFWTPFDGVPSSFRPPLYPLLVAALEQCGGGPRALALLQLVLGTATVALTLRIGKKLNLGGLSLIAGTLVAFDPLLIQYTTFPMTETLFTFLLTLLVNAAVKPLDGGTDIRSWPLVRSAIGGILLGACALCRPTIWAAAALFAAWQFWPWLRRKAPGKRRAIMASIVGVCAAIVILPWGIRNWRILNAPVLTTTHGGYTLLLGNNREFFHQVAARPFLEEWKNSEPDRFQKNWFADLVVQMQRDLGPHANEIDQDRWMYRRAGASIVAEPRLFLRACALRFLEFWNIMPLSPTRSAMPSFVNGLITCWYAAEGLLFLVGITTLLRRGNERWSVTLILILSFTLVHLFYWSNMRMRAPLVPLIALLAAQGCSQWRRLESSASQSAGGSQRET